MQFAIIFTISSPNATRSTLKQSIPPFPTDGWARVASERVQKTHPTIGVEIIEIRERQPACCWTTAASTSQPELTYIIETGRTVLKRFVRTFITTTTTMVERHDVMCSFGVNVQPCQTELPSISQVRFWRIYVQPFWLAILNFLN